MIDALLMLGKNETSLSKCTPCRSKKLGQKFDSYGNPRYLNLYRFNYEDESEFQWAFALIIDNANKTITVTKMMPAIHVTDSISLNYDLKKVIYESIMKEVAVIVKRLINEMS